MSDGFVADHLLTAARFPVDGAGTRPTTETGSGSAAPSPLERADGVGGGQAGPLVNEVQRLRAELTAAHTKIQNLETALASSRRIGAAVGILMARRRVSQDAAFDLLRQASQHWHRKLREIAEEVLYTGALPLTSGAPSATAPPTERSPRQRADHRQADDPAGQCRASGRQTR